MPAIGFTVLKEKIVDGSKRQTIRKLRKQPIKVGDTLYLYWHLRRKDCELLKVVKCVETFPIQMQFYENWLDSGEPIWIVDETLPSRTIITLQDFKVEELAQRDGFNNALEMMRWFTKQYGDLNDQTFQVIRW